MQRGDVVLVQLPRPQGRSGREQYGTRPAVVLQSNQSTTTLSTIIVVPLTGQMAAKRFEGSFVVKPDGKNGLTQNSVALTHQVRAIDKSRVKDVIGTFATNDLKTLESKLRMLIGV